MDGIPLPDHIQLNRAERRGLAERARTDAILAGRSKPSPSIAEEQRVSAGLDARHDVEEGLRWVLENIGPTTIVAITPDDPPKGRYLDQSSFPDVAIWARTANDVGENLYWHVNEPRPGLAKKALKAEIVAIRAVAFLDVDAKDGRTIEQALAAIDALPLPPPSVIIASGGGYQPIWLWDRPIPASPEATARVEALGKRLEQMTGSDAVSNIDRILRLPFTRNYPNAKKRAAGREVSVAGLLQRREAV